MSLYSASRDPFAGLLYRDFYCPYCGHMIRMAMTPELDGSLDPNWAPPCPQPHTMRDVTAPRDDLVFSEGGIMTHCVYECPLCGHTVHRMEWGVSQPVYCPKTHSIQLMLKTRKEVR